MIYLDNCATTQPRKEVIEYMTNVVETAYGNPSSIHSFGMDIEHMIDRARATLASILGVNSEEIYFTSGGTESSNIFHHGILSQNNQRNTVLTTDQEHPATEQVLKYYGHKGYEIVQIQSLDNGQIDIDDLKNKLSPDVLLVSFIHVNNQLGVINDISKISKIIKEYDDEILVYSDGVQALGKLTIQDLHRIDGYSVSAHKIHGIKGTGALYKKKDIDLAPIYLGGGQEGGLRSGTENVPGILTFEKALEIMDRNFEKEIKHILDLRTHMLNRIEDIPDVVINTDLNHSVPSIINLSIIDTIGEVLVHFLERDHIYIGTTSACSSNAVTATNLEKLGKSDKIVTSSIRICLSYYLTENDIDIFVDKLKDATVDIRKNMRGR